MTKEEKQEKKKIQSALGVPKNPSLGPLQCGPRFRPTQSWDLQINFIPQCHSLKLLYLEQAGKVQKDFLIITSTETQYYSSFI